MLKSLARQDIKIESSKTAMLVIDLNHWCSHPEIGAAKVLIDVPDVEFQKYYNRVSQIVIPNIKKLLNISRQKKIPIFYSIVGTEFQDLRDWSVGLKISAIGASITSSMPGRDEYKLPKDIEPQKEDVVIHKPGSSFFTSTNLDQRFRRLNVETLILTGLVTNCCVYNTAVSASELGYKVIIVEDCCAALREIDHNVYLNSIISTIFFHVNKVEEVIKELKNGS